ncbi:MAG TPA: glutathione S-transferase N-terminal domain-containing protein [Hydrogenophaga sp.]
MKLFTSLTSPYGRKCRLVAHVAGVADRVEVVDVNYKADEYAKVNPLKKVPALERDDGTVLIDSAVISAYLASLGDEAKVYPAGDARWSCLSLEALGDGLTDAGVLVYLEKRRDGEKCSDAWVAQQTGKINSGLDALEAQAAGFKGRTDIGVLSVAASIGWLEFRSVVPNIRDGRPNLAAWLDDVYGQAFMKDTAPPPGA